MITKSDAKTLAAFQKKAKKIVTRIAKDRDKLRELVSEYEDIISSVEEAEDHLILGLETLSEYL